MNRRPTKPYVSADDIQQLFYQQGRKRRLPSWQLISACFLIVCGVFTLLNAPAVSQQLAFWWQNDIQAGQNVQPTFQQPGVEPPVDPTLSEQTTSIQPIRQSRVSKTIINPATIADNSVYIPKTNIKAPIVWDVTAGSDVTTDMLKALQNGVARYPQTALPNQIGNVFLTGHSSNYWWDKGHYKTIFALLNRLVVGDVIYVKYQNTLYTYKVSGQKVVPPSDTTVLAATKTPTLSLMTCTPTGTTLFRRIVTANLVSPTENLAAQPTTPNATAIESIR